MSGMTGRASRFLSVVLLACMAACTRSNPEVRPEGMTGKASDGSYLYALDVERDLLRIGGTGPGGDAEVADECLVFTNLGAAKQQHAQGTLEGAPIQAPGIQLVHPRPGAPPGAPCVHRVLAKIVALVECVDERRIAPRHPADLRAANSRGTDLAAGRRKYNR